MTAQITAGCDGILEAGETVSWHGHHAADAIRRATLSPIGAMGASFAVFPAFCIGIAAFAPLGVDAPLPAALFPLFGLPFLAALLFMRVGRPRQDAHMFHWTWHGLSDRTAFIGVDTDEKQTLDRSPPSDMPFAEHRDSARVSSGPGGKLEKTAQQPQIGFVHVHAAEDLHRQMRAARAAFRTRTETQ